MVAPAAGGGEGAEVAGERVLEDTAGGASQAVGRGQALRHVAGVGDGDARIAIVTLGKLQSWRLGSSRDAAEHFLRGHPWRPVPKHRSREGRQADTARRRKGRLDREGGGRRGECTGLRRQGQRRSRQGGSRWELGMDGGRRGGQRRKVVVPPGSWGLGTCETVFERKIEKSYSTFVSKKFC